MYNSYLVLSPREVKEKEVNTYLDKMITENEIKGLIPCEIRLLDMQERYYYNISSKQAVVNVFEKGQVDEIQTSKLVKNIIAAVKEAKRYMLPEDDFILAPEYVFMNISNFDVGLCYLPGYNRNIKKQLSEFLEFILEKVNHNNEKAIVMAYGLYKLIREGNVSFDNIEEYMRNILEGKQEDVFTFHSNIEEVSCIDMEGEDKYEDECVEQEIDKEKILSVSQNECRLDNLYCGKIIGIAGIVYVLIMICVYLSGIANKAGELNWPLYLSVAFSVLCVMIAVVIILKQKREERKEGELQEKQYMEEYEEADYWNEELSINEEEDDRTVLLMPDKRITRFALRTITGEVITIGAFPFVIGKVKEKVDYCIEDATISRLHAKLDECDEDVLYVTDLNSTNGTYVRDKRLKANEVVKLGLNETFKVGEHIFQLIKD